MTNLVCTENVEVARKISVRGARNASIMNFCVKRMVVGRMLAAAWSSNFVVCGVRIRRVEGVHVAFSVFCLRRSVRVSNRVVNAFR